MKSTEIGDFNHIQQISDFFLFIYSSIFMCERFILLNIVPTKHIQCDKRISKSTSDTYSRHFALNSVWRFFLSLSTETLLFKRRCGSLCVYLVYCYSFSSFDFIEQDLIPFERNEQFYGHHKRKTVDDVIDQSNLKSLYSISTLFHWHSLTQSGLFHVNILYLCFNHIENYTNCSWKDFNLWKIMLKWSPFFTILMCA